MLLLLIDPVPFLVEENAVEENCYAYNSSIYNDEALPPICVDGCCCPPTRRFICNCCLDPFYICWNGSAYSIESNECNGSHVYTGETCNCPTILCICIRNATIEINNTHLFYQPEQICCPNNNADPEGCRTAGGCRTLAEVRRMIVGGKIFCHCIFRKSSLFIDSLFTTHNTFIVCIAFDTHQYCTCTDYPIVLTKHTLIH